MRGRNRAGAGENQSWPKAGKGAQLARLDTFEIMELATPAHHSQWRQREGVMIPLERPNYSS